MLDEKKLQSDANHLRNSYANEEPFPNIVIDSFLPDDIANTIVNCFPNPAEMDLSTYQAEERKIAMSPAKQGFPAAAKNILYTLNSHEMLNFLETLTGINGLIPDPHFHGAGLQQTMTGGGLGIHIDFNKYEKLKLDRRLNVLIYLNKEWDESWGGHLELWNKEMTECMKKISPIFNRCVIFSTSDISYHGLPNPIQCPKGVTRKQINLYYYTNGRNDRASDISGHWTIHKKRIGNLRDSVQRPLLRVTRRILPKFISDKFRKKVLKSGE